MAQTDDPVFPPAQWGARLPWTNGPGWLPPHPVHIASNDADTADGRPTPEDSLPPPDPLTEIGPGHPATRTAPAHSQPGTATAPPRPPPSNQAESPKPRSPPATPGITPGKYAHAPADD